MNDDEAVDLIVGAVLDSLLRRMSERPQLRAAVHHLALRLAEATRPVEEPAGRPAGAEAQAQARPASAPDDPERTAAADAEPLQARADPPPPLATKLLRLGSASMELEVPGSPESTAPAAPARGNAGGPMVPTRDHSSPATLPVGQDESLTLSIVAKRCRLKAEACRWIVSGGRELLQARPPSMREEDLVRRARAFPRCFLWMLHEGARLTSDRGLERIAACYENAGAAAELVSDILHDERRVDDLLPDAMRLLAEAQSALRVALAAAAIDREEDQYAAFRWLRERAERHRIYVERHMRLDDPADPEASDDLEQRLERFRDGFEGWQRCEAERRKLLGKVRYHCKRLAGGDAVDPAEEWRTVLATVASLVEGGLPISDVGLRDLLLPVMDRLPEEVEPPPAARRVLGEIDAFLDSRPTAQEPAPRARGPEVLQAAELLRGRVAVLLGGEQNQAAARDLEEVLELAELRWISKRPHGPIAPFEEAVSRPEVAVVFFLAKFSNKNDGPSVRRLCRTYGKPCVMLTGGHNASRVAHELLAQASDAFR